MTLFSERFLYHIVLIDRLNEIGTIAKISLQTGSPYGLFWDLLSNGAQSKARGQAREGEPAMVLSDSERKLLVGQFDLTHVKYYHLRSTAKCECFFAHVYFSNEAWSCDLKHGTISTVGFENTTIFELLWMANFFPRYTLKIFKSNCYVFGGFTVKFWQLRLKLH